MPGGCWICNPMCGRCKPPAYKSFNCPECHTPTLFEKAKIIAGEPLHCKKCGYDATDEVRPKVVHCNYSGLLCAYPCGNSTHNEDQSFAHQKCELNTPPSEEWFEAHPKAHDLAHKSL